MTKRIISVLLALVLVLALAMPAMAADQTYTLTITDSKTGAKYQAYQIFSGSYMVETEEPYTAYLGDLAWGSGVTPDADGKIDGMTAEQTKDTLVNPSAARTFAKNISDNLSTTFVPATSDGTSAVFTLPAGYYLIKEVDVTEDSIASAFIMQLVGDETVQTKRSEIPVPEKEANKVTVATGEDITYTISATLSEDLILSDYTEYFLGFYDTLDPTLDYVSTADQVVVKNGDTEIPKDAYTCTIVDRNLTVEFKNVKPYAKAGDTITVTYVAETNASAVRGAEGNENTFYLEYSNNPSTDEKGKTEEITEIVYTIDLAGLKVDANEPTRTLEGAEFVLWNEAQTAQAIVDKDSKDITWAATGDTFTTNSDGQISIPGLSAGTYYLEETKAPAGYNKLESKVKVVITFNEETKAFSVAVDNGEAKAATATQVEVTVQNNKGTTLPSTGGIGTTIFYLVGGLMMAAAVVLLVAKKRTVNE